MIFDIIHIGYFNNYNIIIYFLKKYEIDCIKKEDIFEGSQFLDIETKNLCECCLLCFGEYCQLDVEKKMDDIKIIENLSENDRCTLIARMYFEREKNMLLKDAEFWVAFITDFINTFQTIGIYGTYS